MTYLFLCCHHFTVITSLHYISPLIPRESVFSPYGSQSLQCIVVIYRKWTVWFLQGTKSRLIRPSPLQWPTCCERAPLSVSGNKRKAESISCQRGAGVIVLAMVIQAVFVVCKCVPHARPCNVILLTVHYSLPQPTAFAEELSRPRWRWMGSVVCP